MSNEKELTPVEARKILWERGILTFKLDHTQLEMVNNFKFSEKKVTVWSCSRRLGKTRTLCLLAIEYCIKKPNAIVKFLCPTQKMVKTNIRPIMRELTADCPEEMRPIEKVAEGIWYFPSTGSQIQIAGCDGGKADSIRGTSGDLCIVDEAGFVSSDLKYIVNSILLPLTTTTKGRIILASTPPKSPTHDFVYFINKAKSEKAFIHKTIFDNPRLTQQDIDILAEAVGGYESQSFRREYLAQVIIDKNLAIVPEFESVKHKIVKEWIRPPFYDTYVAMDLGVKDLTVVLFAYFDFRANKLIIEDELVSNGQFLTTAGLADGIKEKESKCFSDPFTGDCKPPLKRISDNNLQVIGDLWRLHGLYFFPTRKDDADAALNNMRILIKDEQIIINPRCETLINHLESGIWNKNKTNFARVGSTENDSDSQHHFDALDSLKYLVRNVEFQKNPYPASFGLVSGPSAFYKNGPPTNNNSVNAHAWKKIMNIK